MATKTISIEITRAEYAAFAFAVGMLTPMISVFPDEAMLPFISLIAKVQEGGKENDWGKYSVHDSLTQL